MLRDKNQTSLKRLSPDAEAKVKIMRRFLIITLVAWSLLTFQGLAALPLFVPPQIRSTTGLAEKELEGLLDPVFTEQMAKLHIPGAMVVVVKDGKIVFTKGYGYADIAKKTPVVPDQTIFRIGSITKVFTATAVMQLADRGKISLNDDINKYLKGFQVSATYPQPITFANLLTHTSGLDEITPGRRTSDESKVVPLAEFLKTRMVRLLPPGQIISYSTYNAAPGGLLVEQITGTPFKA
jgi:CubicO group peptidase (beta-lactamase class C family)